MSKKNSKLNRFATRALGFMALMGVGACNLGGSLNEVISGGAGGTNAGGTQGDSDASSDGGGWDGGVEFTSATGIDKPTKSKMHYFMPPTSGFMSSMITDISAGVSLDDYKAGKTCDATGDGGSTTCKEGTYSLSVGFCSAATPNMCVAPQSGDEFDLSAEVAPFLSFMYTVCKSGSYVSYSVPTVTPSFNNDTMQMEYDYSVRSGGITVTDFGSSEGDKISFDFDGVVLKDNNGSGSNSITLSGTATDIQVMANPCQ